MGSAGVNSGALILFDANYWFAMTRKLIRLLQTNCLLSSATSSIVSFAFAEFLLLTVGRYQPVAGLL
jgi:hypothetical protein